MSALDLARLQFAVTTTAHWLFVILTMGLVPLVAVMHTRAAVSRDPGRRMVLERMTRFWGQLYLINYALGIVTGLVMEFQFGLSWSGLSKFAGNVFGAPLALETLIAFFAESTFLGMWIFGWGRLRPAVHVTLIWLVALTAYLSAYWILVANGFMQHPVGYRMVDGTAQLTDFGALLTNSSTLTALGHIAMAALLTGGLFVAGVSAYHLLRGTSELDLFRRSQRTGVVVAAAAAYPVYLVGAAQYPILGATQPMKLAALAGEGVQELQQAMVAANGPGDYVPPGWMAVGQYVMLYLGYLVASVALAAFLVLFRRQLLRYKVVAALVAAAVAFPISEFAGAGVFNEPGPYRLWFYAASLAAVTAVLVLGDRLRRTRWLGWCLVLAIPLPFVASVGGWVFREVGRQPWIVYGQLAVDDAVSSVSTGTVLASFVVFTAILSALTVVNWTLIARYARRGPAGTQLGVEPLPEKVLTEETTA